MENLLEYENWSIKKKIEWNPEGCIFVKGLPMENGKSHLFLFKIKNVSLLKRTKKVWEQGEPVYMATFHPEIYKVSYNKDRKLVASKVMSNKQYLDRFVGLSDFSIGLNNNKTPYWWETAKETKVRKVLDNFQAWIESQDWVKIPVINI